MFRAFISDKFTDRRVAQGSFPQCTARLIQLDIPDDLKKSFSGTFFDQGAEMGNTVTKMAGCLAQRNCLVMLVQIVQDLCDRISGSILCKYGFDIVLVITKQHRPEHDQHGVEKGIAVFLVAEILNIEIFQHISDPYIISTMEDQIISLRLAVQHMCKKLRQGTVSRQ